MIAGKKYDGLLTDIWSLGIILYAMVCGYLPFEDQDISKLYNKILKQDYTQPDFLSLNLKDILSKILSKNPKERYRINDIRRHPWYHLVEPIEEQVSLIVYSPIPSLLSELSKYGIDQNYAKRCLETNRHNETVTVYYLLQRKNKTKEKISKKSASSKDIFGQHAISNTHLLYKEEVKRNKTPVPTKYEDYYTIKNMKYSAYETTPYRVSNKRETITYDTHKDVLRANAVYYSELNKDDKYVMNMYSKIISKPRMNRRKYKYPLNPNKDITRIYNAEVNLVSQNRIDSPYEEHKRSYISKKLYTRGIILQPVPIINKHYANTSNAKSSERRTRSNFRQRKYSKLNEHSSLIHN